MGGKLHIRMLWSISVTECGLGMIFLYNILGLGISILGLPLILPWIATTEKRRKTVLKRLGIILPKREGLPEKPRIWVHALSVGEVLSAIPLVKTLHNNNAPIVFSASTQTGFQIAAEKLNADNIYLFYFPYDFLFSIERILDHIQPAAVIIVETDLWPNFLFKLKQKRIPVFLVNAKLSDRSFKGYKRFRSFMESMLKTFQAICTQTLSDAERFHALGVPYTSIFHTGNIKFDQSDGLPHSFREHIDLIKKSIKTRTIVAGSTHDGEEALLGDVFERTRKIDNQCTLIIAPRDPKRADDISRSYRRAGFSVSRYSELPSRSSRDDIDVIIIDRLGVLRYLYALADIAFIGGSLFDYGGHNPLEPAMFSVPIVFGPYMRDFRDISHKLLEADAAVQVDNPDQLFHTIQKIFSDKIRADRLGKNAYTFFNSNKGAIDKTVKVLNRKMRI